MMHHSIYLFIVQLKKILGSCKMKLRLNRSHAKNLAKNHGTAFIMAIEVNKMELIRCMYNQDFHYNLPAADINIPVLKIIKTAAILATWLPNCLIMPLKMSTKGQ